MLYFPCDKIQFLWTVWKHFYVNNCAEQIAINYETIKSNYLTICLYNILNNFIIIELIKIKIMILISIFYEKSEFKYSRYGKNDPDCRLKPIYIENKVSHYCQYGIV